MKKLMLALVAGAVMVLFTARIVSAYPQILKGHIPKAATINSMAGPLADTVSLDLVIGLSLPDPKGLDNFLKDVYDPKSPRYRHFLTPEEFAARFSPSAADYQAAVNLLKSKGLRVTATFPDRLMVDIKATAADIRKVFHVNLNNFRRPDGRLFYAPDAEPSLDCPVSIGHISGLDNFA